VGRCDVVKCTGDAQASGTEFDFGRPGNEGPVCQGTIHYSITVHVLFFFFFLYFLLQYKTFSLFYTNSFYFISHHHFLLISKINNSLLCSVLFCNVTCQTSPRGRCLTLSCPWISIH
jgi:hypothetical protein